MTNRADKAFAAWFVFCALLGLAITGSWRVGCDRGRAVADEQVAAEPAVTTEVLICTTGGFRYEVRLLVNGRQHDREWGGDPMGCRCMAWRLQRRYRSRMRLVAREAHRKGARRGQR